MSQITTDTQIRNLRDGDGFKSCGGSLYINAQKNGLRAWYYRFKLCTTGKNTWYSFGEWCKRLNGETKQEAQLRKDGGRRTLAEARAYIQTLKDITSQGIHPKDYFSELEAQEQRSKSTTFRSIAEQWQMANIEAGEWSFEYERSIRNTFEKDICSRIGKLPFSEIDSRTLRPIVLDKAKTAPTMAKNMRLWLHGLFEWGAANGYYDEAKRNPTELLRKAFKVPEPTSHQPLEPEHIKKLAEWAASARSEPKTKMALELMLYTMVRPAMAATAHWKDVDLNKALWRVKGHRRGNKTEVTYTVPLSKQVIELFERAKLIYGDEGYVFPHRNKPKASMHHNTPYAALRRTGWTKDTDSSPHAFRTTALTMLLEAQKAPRDVLNKALGHSEGNKVLRAYDNAESLSARTPVMQVWADYVDEMMKSGAKAQL